MNSPAVEIPPAIRKGIESFSDEGFWTEENLTKCFEINSEFGSAISFGFDELLGEYVQPDTFEHCGLDSLTSHISTFFDDTGGRVWAVMELRALAKKCWKMTDEDLSIQEVLMAAYVAEVSLLSSPQVFGKPTIPQVILDHQRLGGKAFQVEDARLVEEGTEILRKVFASH